MVSHLLLQLLQGAAQAGRARRLADAEHARRRAAVEFEQDAKRDHLSLACRELAERLLKRRREALAERPLVRLRGAGGVARLAAAAALLGTEVVERGAARDLAEPGARRRAARGEAPPRAERLLEGLPREVFGDRAVSGHEQQVAIDGVEVLLRDCGEARPGGHADAHPRRPRAHRRVHAPFYVAGV